MATMLASVDARCVVKCDHCDLVQFIPTAGISAPCRRCHVPLDKPDPATEIPAPESPAISLGTAALDRVGPQQVLANAIRSLRIGKHLSQRQLALRMRVPRTYVSKIENEKTMPTIASLEKIAAALQTTISGLLCGGERSRREQVDELARD